MDRKRKKNTTSMSSSLNSIMCQKEGCIIQGVTMHNIVRCKKQYMGTAFPIVSAVINELQPVVQGITKSVFKFKHSQWQLYLWICKIDSDFSWYTILNIVIKNKKKRKR